MRKSLLDFSNACALSVTEILNLHCPNSLGRNTNGFCAAFLLPLAGNVEADGEMKMTKTELIQMIENAGFEAVERDTVYNRVAPVAA